MAKNKKGTLDRIYDKASEVVGNITAAAADIVTAGGSKPSKSGNGKKPATPKVAGNGKGRKTTETAAKSASTASKKASKPVAKAKSRAKKAPAKSSAERAAAAK